MMEIHEQPTAALVAQAEELERQLSHGVSRIDVDHAEDNYLAAVNVRGAAEEALEAAENRGLKGPALAPYVDDFEYAGGKVESAWGTFQTAQDRAAAFRVEHAADFARLDEIRDELAYRSVEALSHDGRHLHAVPDRGVDPWD